MPPRKIAKPKGKGKATAADHDADPAGDAAPDAAAARENQTDPSEPQGKFLFFSGCRDLLWSRDIVPFFFLVAPLLGDMEKSNGFFSFFLDLNRIRHEISAAKDLSGNPQ